MHLHILRKLCTGPLALRADNHTLPMIEELHYDDMVFAVFPRVGDSIESPWFENYHQFFDFLVQTLEVCHPHPLPTTISE